MTNDQKEIGAKWLAILNEYNKDFATKSLFNQTALYLRSLGTAPDKRVSRFNKEVKEESQKQRSLLKPLSLLEAAKLREEQEEDEHDYPTNLLAISEGDTYDGMKKGKGKGKQNV
jgi:hypothetical protein